MGMRGMARESKESRLLASIQYACSQGDQSVFTILFGWMRQGPFQHHCLSGLASKNPSQSGPAADR
jgi:hypothetical protein